MSDKNETASNESRGTGARGAVTGAEMVRTALRAADWRAYAAANGLSGDWRRARRYGLSPKELHALYLEQEGCCYLCGDPLPKDLARAAIDHDHTCCPTPSGYRTSCGKCVRGISCAPCNRLIASAQDDPDRLRRIADNLEAANHRVGRPGRMRGAREPMYGKPGVGSPGVGSTDRRFTRTSRTKTDHEDQDQPQSQEQPNANSQNRRVHIGPGDGG